MISNERQYRITKAEAERFTRALAEAGGQSAHLHPLLQKALREGLESQLEELQAQLTEYEALRAGKITVVELGSLEELPDVLMRARVAAGLTQRQLAERVGLRAQQIQRYEATRYAAANLARLQEIAEALGLQIRERVLLPVRRAGADEPETARPDGSDGAVRTGARASPGRRRTTRRRRTV